MNDSSMSSNYSVVLTSTVLSRVTTTSNIPYREQVLMDAFNTYIQIGIGSLLFLFGLTFNCLSLIYFRASRSFRHTTFQLYFSIISILDTVRLLEFVVFILFDKGYLNVTLKLCRWVFFTIMFTGQASIWLTVALAVEKCVIIWFPIKGRLCFTISVSKVVLVVVLCLVLSANLIYLSPKFFLHAYQNLSIHTFMCLWQTGGEATRSKYDQWKKHYFTFNTIFFHSIIPSVLLLIINWLILYSLSRQRFILSKIGTIDSRNALKREKQFKEKTIQLVLSSFFVIFTISPRYILTMVNAFATNITKKPLMPLYIYINLNTVFRVLEMSNYSLNLMFAIMSGRTSRREIRKLLGECLFWRFKRVKTSRHGSKIHSHPFLFDDDDDTERSMATTTGVTSYCPLAHQAPHRLQYLSQQNSSNHYSIPSSPKSSFFTCCGVRVDLSHKHSIHSSNGELTSWRPAVGKSTTNTNNNPHYSLGTLPNRSQSPLSYSSSSRSLRHQQKVGGKLSGDFKRAAVRRRSTTLVHCFQPLASPTRTTISDRSVASKKHSSFVDQSLSTGKESSSFETLPPHTSDSPETKSDVFNAKLMLIKDITEIHGFGQNHLDEQQLPAYVVETC